MSRPRAKQTPDEPDVDEIVRTLSPQQLEALEKAAREARRKSGTKNPRGRRPEEGIARSETVNLKVTPKTKEAMEAAAKRLRCSVSEYVRRLHAEFGDKLTPPTGGNA